MTDVLVAAAVCPNPPLLVPGVGAGASGELDELRTACDAAVADLLASDLSLVVVVGSAAATGPFADGAWGSLSSYGVRVPVGSGEGDPTLPLSLTLGRWLLDRAANRVPARLVGIEPDAAPEDCAALGVALASDDDRLGLLVMGDGSARRSLKGPAGLHPDAEAFDVEVEQALRAGDADALAALDPDRAAALLAAGRAPWQVLAGAAKDGRWRGSVTWLGSPYGVTYLVASWTAVG